MPVEKDHAKQFIQSVREALPGVKDKLSDVSHQFKENPREFLTQKPVLWTLGVIAVVGGTWGMVAFYGWFAARGLEGDRAFKDPSRERSVLAIRLSTGEVKTLRGEDLEGNGPFTDPQTKTSDWWRALTSANGYYAAQPGPDGGPPPTPTAVPTAEPTATPRGRPAFR